MGDPRTKAREFAMQALFYMDMCHHIPEEAYELFCENFPVSEKSLPMFSELVNGIIPLISDLDAIIEHFSDNWKTSRMSGVDRNAMRIAVYEMLFREDIPVKVSINEAINIGKKFGTEDSGSFINGILDSIRIAKENHEINLLRPYEDEDRVEN